MATDQAIQQLDGTIGKLNAVDSEKLLRRSLGDESLESVFGPELEKVRSLAAFVTQHGRSVHSDHVNQARATLDVIANEMQAQANRPSAEYISNRANFLSGVRTQLEEARRWLPFFAASAVLERGFLEDEGIRREYRRVVDDLKAQTAATLATVKEEADKAVSGAKTLADEIEARARRSATRTSVEEAQRQFKEASDELATKVKTWGWIAAGSIGALILLPFAFMAWPLPAPEPWPLAVYHTILRVFVLSAAGAAATVAIRIFRAHLHMVEKNRHRVRVANSVESFVNSALEPQQRDLLLAKLTEAIVDFGDSGIIRGDKDDSGSTVVSGELLGRILAALTPKR